MRYHERSLMFLLTGSLLTTFMLSPWAGHLEDTDLAFHMMAEHIGFALGAILISSGSEKMILGLFAAGRSVWFTGFHLVQRKASGTLLVLKDSMSSLQTEHQICIFGLEILNSVSNPRLS